jgi:hypothetical protein
MRIYKGELNGKKGGGEEWRVGEICTVETRVGEGKKEKMRDVGG